MKLENKVALVTGGGSGIGRATALRFAQEGARVTACDVDEAGVNETAALIGQQGGSASGVVGNVADRGDVQRVVDTVLDKFGRLDILINNAGIIRRCDAIDFSEKDWDDVMSINAKTVFFLSQAAARRFIAQGSGGKIVSIDSMLSFQGGIRVPSYTASKSAVMGVTRAMANEWAKYNIQVNAIAPGYMATNNTKALRDDETRAGQILERIPASRWGTPDDVKGPAVFLCSKASDYVTGYTVAVDGGWLAR